MNSKWGQVVASCLFFAGVVVMVSPGLAQDEGSNVGKVPPGLAEKAKVDQEWEKAADTNQDGVVDQVEMRQWKNRGKRNNVSSGEAESQGTAEESSTTSQADSDSSQSASAQDASLVNRPWEKAADANKDGQVDKTEFGQWNQKGNNPPGSIGGPGASQNVNTQDASQVNRPWERKADANKDGNVDRREVGQWNKQGNNPPGAAGGPGASQNQPRRDKDNNPPGARGGQGTNWENKPGPAGGQGASPNRGGGGKR